MAHQPNGVEKHIHIPVVSATRLGRLAQAHQVSEDQVVAKALDPLEQLKLLQRSQLPHLRLDKVTLWDGNQL